MPNPIINAVFWSGIGLNSAVSAISNIVSPYRKANAEHNVKSHFDGFIFDQCEGAASQLKMGYHQTSYNGCGCIAAYNASLVKGNDVQPSEIIAYYEKHGGTVLNGLWGVNPLAVKRLFVSMGEKAAIHYFPRKSGLLDGLIKDSAVSILAYVHKRGMHYVAIKLCSDGFHVYNEYSGCTDCIHYPSIEKWLKNASFTAVSLIQIF